MTYIDTNYYKNIKEKKEDFSSTEVEKINTILSRDLKNTISQSQQLSTTVLGIRHEVSPWIGAISNIIERLNDTLKECEEDCTKNNPNCKIVSFKYKCEEKFKEVLNACDQAVNILSMMSKSVKKIQTYSVGSYNVSETIDSWVKLVLMDRIIKSSISEHNIEVDLKSLDFVAEHSPMLLTQIILNLAKNSIEHNTHMLDRLHIKIDGNVHDNTICFTDNGKGIPSSIITKVFQPGITTKNEDKAQHGFGLAACLDYCVAMNSMMWCQSDGETYTKFIINLDVDNTRNKLKKKYSTQEINVYTEKRTNFLTQHQDYLPHDMEKTD